MDALGGRRVVVGVDAGPTAFEAPDLVRRLVRAGAEVKVAMTEAAERWIPALTLETVSRAPVGRLPEEARAWGEADLVVLSPVGSDLLGRLVAARGFDAASEAFLRAPHRAVVVPGTDLPDDGWVGANLDAVAERAVVLERGAAPADVVLAAGRAVGPRDLTGRKVVITAGPTREHFDPVRFLSNPSSGRMGYALAEAARRRGAEVVLCSGPTHLAAPAGVEIVRVVSARDLAAAVERHREGAAAFIAAAAVSDWRPAAVAEHKVKKDGEDRPLELVRNPDVLAEVSAAVAGRADRPVLVGFAAETENLEANAQEKLDKKKLDLVVANLVHGPGGAFGADDNEVLLVSRDGVERLPRRTKREVAHLVLDRVVALLSARG